MTVTVTADNNLTADTTIPLALAASGTGTAAAAAADITGGFTGKSVTINENSAIGIVDVAIVDDTIVEIDETFTIDLGTLPAGFARKDGDTAETITIQDVDNATLTVTISDNPTQNAEVTVTGALNNSIHIGAGNTLTFSSASATGNPDLVFTADTNGLVSGMTTGTHTPTEAGSRTYTYGLASAQHGIQTNRVSSTPATVTIAAGAVVRTGPAVIIPLDTGGEEGTRVTMILQADRPVTDGFTGTYTIDPVTRPGATANNQDYNVIGTFGEYTFAPGATRAEIIFELVTNADPGSSGTDTETISVFLLPVPSEDASKVRLAKRRAFVNIREATGPAVITVTQSAIEVTEGQTVTINIQSTPALTRLYRGTWGASDLTTTKNSDYTFNTERRARLWTIGTANTLTVTAGTVMTMVRPGVITIETIDDSDVEGDEQFVVFLQPSQEFAQIGDINPNPAHIDRAALGNPIAVTVTIKDNDGSGSGAPPDFGDVSGAPRRSPGQQTQNTAR
ncbi:MAG: hypothetical protein MPL62_00370 [Alphaproteobacteria bacterium]|nr:hypothetical protein [Alphaproteobacteria bacterium]